MKRLQLVLPLIAIALGIFGAFATKAPQTAVMAGEHYWTLQAGADPDLASDRTNPALYEDQGAIAPPSGSAPCNTGADELCGIFVEPNPSMSSEPNFSSSVNSDIYSALEDNVRESGKVFIKNN